VWELVRGDALGEAVLARARAGDEEAFRELTEPHRRELQLHCYRILGSVHDAEDMAQETLMAAWPSLEAFEGRASVRSWLYRIATNRCLNALRARSRRPREVPAMGGDSPEPTRRTEPVWLEPYPDVLLEDIRDRAAGPAEWSVMSSCSTSVYGPSQTGSPRRVGVGESPMAGTSLGRRDRARSAFRQRLVAIR